MIRRKMGILVTACCLALPAILTGCGQREAEPAAGESAVEARQYDASDLDSRIAEASNAFGLRLYAELAEQAKSSQEPKDRNLWLSPLSISSALAMAYEGAEGGTADAMAGAMGLSLLKRKEVGPGYRVLLDLLNHPADEGIKLAVADSAWLREGFAYRDSFAGRIRDNYGAEVRTLDFSRKKEALSEMNGWVKEHTNGRIPKIVEDIDRNAALFLLNAVTFQGAWDEPFRKIDDAEFRLSPEDSRTVPMMTRGGHFEYADEAEYEAVRIPIGQEGGYSFLVLLPKPNVELSSLPGKLAANPKLLAEPFESRIGQVTLPMFRIDYSADLSDALKSLGMAEAFDSKLASFSGIAPEPPNLYIGQVLHKSYLQVDENGLEAAAATSVGMLAGAAEPPADPFRMVVDRPFIAAIADAETHALLFVGTVADPG